MFSWLFCIILFSSEFVPVASVLYVLYLLSIFSLEVFSVVLAISGITLFAYSDGFGGASLLGVSLAVLSAVGAALYKVCGFGGWGCS